MRKMVEIGVRDKVEGGWLRREDKGGYRRGSREKERDRRKFFMV